MLGRQIQGATGGVPTKVSFAALPSGARGRTRATLRLMSRLIREGKRDYRIREKTLQLVQHLPPKAYKAEASAIFHFVRDQIRYVKDIDGIETLAEPWKTIEIGQGDCDDKVMLASAMLQAIGHPVRIIAAGFNHDPPSHVFLQTAVGWAGREPVWVSMELTEPWPMGTAPPGITSMMVENLK